MKHSVIKTTFDAIWRCYSRKYEINWGRLLCTEASPNSKRVWNTPFPFLTVNVCYNLCYVIPSELKWQS